MSLEGLLMELDKKKTHDLEKQIQMLSEQHDANLRAKDEEISGLREEIETLRCWLDSSALPAFNPISKRNDSLGLVKMNFGKDKPCPELWSPGEKELLASVDREPSLMSEQSQDESQAPGKSHLEEFIPVAPPRLGPTPLIPEEKPELPKEPILDKPAIPEFNPPDLELPVNPEPDGSPAAGGIVVDLNGNDSDIVPIPSPVPTPKGTSKKSARARKPGAAKLPRRTSFPKLKKATSTRRKKSG